MSAYLQHREYSGGTDAEAVKQFESERATLASMGYTVVLQEWHDEPTGRVLVVDFDLGRLSGVRRHAPAQRLGCARTLCVLALLGCALLVVIGIVIPGKGLWTDQVAGVMAPEEWLGTGRWLVPVFMVWLAVYIIPPVRGGWGQTLLGDSMALVGFLGLLALVAAVPQTTGFGGGRIGSFVGESLSAATNVPVAMGLCLIATVVGLRIVWMRRI